MKLSIILFSIIISISSCSQDNSPENDIIPTVNICDCYSEKIAISEHSDFHKYYDECINSYFANNKSEIIKHLNVKDSTSIMNELKKLNGKVMLNMIEYCQPYSEYSERLKGRLFISADQEKTLTTIDSLSILLKNNQTSIIYRDRAFQRIRIRDYDKALEDLKRAKELNSKDWKVYSYSGWIYEKTGDLNKSLSIYEKGLELDQNNFYLQIAVHMVRGKLKR